MVDKETPMTVEDISKYLQLHRNTVYKLCKANRLPHYRVGKKIRFNKNAIDRILSGEVN